MVSRTTVWPLGGQATTHRQALTHCHAYLSRRELYDQTGSLQDSEELAGEQYEELYKYYRGIYKKVGCCRAVWLCMHSLVPEPKKCLQGCSRLRRWEAGKCEGLHIHPAMDAPVTKVHLQGSKVGYTEAVHAQLMRARLCHMSAHTPWLQGAAQAPTDATHAGIADRAGWGCPQEPLVSVVVQVTEEDILSFEAEYCGSTEEQQDLLRHYTQFQGDMQQVGPAI